MCCDNAPVPTVIEEYEKQRSEGARTTRLEDALHSAWCKLWTSYNRLAKDYNDLNEHVEELLETFGIGEG
jgi:hypothetical protein